MSIKTPLLTLLVLATPLAAHGATLSVCGSCTHDTIQKAVDAADPDDEILVASDTFAAFTVVDKSLTISSLSGSGSTTISGGNEIIIEQTGGTAVEVSITGLTVSLAKRAFRVTGGASLILDDIVASGYTSNDDGHAVKVESFSSAVVKNSTFANNDAGTKDGGNFVATGDGGLNGGSLTIDNCTVSGGTAQLGGAAMIKDDAELIIIGGSWSESTAEGTHGGTISMRGDGSSVHISGGASFMDGWADDDGGHIHDADGGTITIDGAHFEDGIADNGGSIWSDGGTLSLTDVDFVDGFALDAGGHLYLGGGSFTMTGGKLDDGLADFGGGALFDGVVTVEMDDVHVLGNNADATGGGIYVKDGSVDFIEVDFELNTAVDGGGLMLDSSGGTVFGGTFDDNDASSFGGAVWHTRDAALTITNTWFEDNEAATGAGLASDDNEATAADITVEGATFVNNDASGSGGALYFKDAGDIDITDSWFEGNDTGTTGNRVGGGMWVDGADTVDMIRSTFCDNSAQWGAGAYVKDVTGSLSFDNNVFMDNTATLTGGGLRLLDNGTATMRHNHFVGNAATVGGAVGFNNTDHAFVNNLVMGSTTVNGVYAEETEVHTVTYNLWYQNSAAHIAGDVTSLPASNVVDEDPMLQGYVAGGPCDDNLWPALGSPLIDAGDPTGSNDLALPGTIPSAANPPDIGAYGGQNSDPAPWIDFDDDDYPVMWDCDDTQSSVFPGTYYDDTDGDSHGDPGNSVEGCAPGTGTWVTVAGDCDPTDGTVFPGATELCDGQVNSCGGTMLAGEVDADGDHQSVCALDVGGWDGAGSVTSGGDCDDDEDTVFDGATELCDGQLNDCGDAMLAGEVDADGDQYVVCTLDGDGWDGSGTVTGGDDCDDDDTTVYPGAAELCDGQLNDCDGTMLVGEVDADGDEYVVCELDAGGWDGSGTVVGGEDCDDDDADSHPNYVEICDDLADNDCNGITDTDATDSTWYADNDGDGFGDPATGIEDCKPPTADHVLDNTDCDDDLSSANPDATEVWYDGIDQDCDGNDADQDVDGFDSDAVDGGTDCDDLDAAINPDAEEILDNDVDEDCADGPGVTPPENDAEIHDLSGRLLGVCGCATGSGPLPALPILLGLGCLIGRRRRE